MTNEEIAKKIEELNKVLDEAKVPTEDRWLWVTEEHAEQFIQAMKKI